MSSLYELTGDYAKFADIAEQADLDDEMKEALNDALGNLTEDIDDKLEGYGKVIKNFEADINAIEAEIDRLTKKKKSLDGTIKNMKKAMIDAIILTTEPDKKGVVKRKGVLFSFTVKNNAESVVWDTKDLNLIPDMFKVQSDPTLNTSLMKSTLQKGTEEEKERLQGIAHLERSKSLLIK